MTPAKLKPPAHDTPADTTAAVDRFMAETTHRFKAEIETLRRAILGVDAAIREGIKWNAPSFRTTEYFATVNLRSKAGIGLILHLGAKTRELPAAGVKIADPKKLLTWLGKDRALVDFASPLEVDANVPALQDVLRQWIRYV